MSDAIYWSAKRIADAIRAGELSAREAVEACLERIEQVNPEINAVVQLVAERALAEADAPRPPTRRGIFCGALHGVPITIKDSLDTAGIVSTGGTLGRKHYLPRNGCAGGGAPARRRRGAAGQDQYAGTDAERRNQ